MTPEPTIAALAGKLTRGEMQVFLHPRFDPHGWEPANPSSPLIVTMIEKGFLRRSDGRCGFERLKNSHVVPTDLGKILAHHLRTQGGESDA